MKHPLLDIPASFHKGEPRGITSVCPAHPVVIEAALSLARERDRPALIETTCNQVNQDGGYTGMTPGDFRRFVEEIADKIGYPSERIIVGGDHLGPNPWKSFPPDEAMAMAMAKVMIAAFAEAGFTKLHLDTSMGVLGEPAALDDAMTTECAAKLAAVAEARNGSAIQPVYIIGTEAPVPGGAIDGLDHLWITQPAAVATTYVIHRNAFETRGLEDAFARVIALVVQQGFASLKVGPWLTFALREALYALDAVADVIDGRPPQGKLMAAMEEAMQEVHGNWSPYYTGSSRERWLHRHFSYSDRICYYWPSETAQSAVKALLARLKDKTIPAPVMSQFLGKTGQQKLEHRADQVLLSSVKDVLRLYERTATTMPQNSDS